MNRGLLEVAEEEAHHFPSTVVEKPRANIREKSLQGARRQPAVPLRVATALARVEVHVKKLRTMKRERLQMVGIESLEELARWSVHVVCPVEHVEAI